MKTLSLIIMAAGSSSRFCNNESAFKNSSIESNFIESNNIESKVTESRIIESNFTESIESKKSKVIESKTIESTKSIESKIIESTPQDSKDSKVCKDSKTPHDCKDSKDSTDSIKSQNSQQTKPKIPHTKKQWIRLGITPLWLYVLESLSLKILRFHALDKIIITCNKIDKIYMQKLAPSSIQGIPVVITQGGESRFQSLKNALQSVESSHVIVSDCARAYVADSTLEWLFRAFLEGDADCIAPYLPLSDTTILQDGDTLTHLKRENLRLIQTPQISSVNKLIESTKLNIDFSDETSAINALPHAKITLIQGDKKMDKLTTLSDLHLLKPLLDSKNTSVLIGQGSDIHAFEAGKTMHLCGVIIESKSGFKAHSDGDVGIHAIIDALLGAMNCGDIGELFPDSDATYKDADSKILLKNVYDYCLSTGLEIVNIDVTIFAQTPKIAPYKSQMQETLAQILYLSKSQISLKATTTESLGFIGRKEGVLAQAIAQLKPRDIFKEISILKEIIC